MRATPAVSAPLCRCFQGANERCSLGPFPPSAGPVHPLRHRAESAVGARGNGSIWFSRNTQETVTSDFKPRLLWILYGRVNVTWHHLDS